MGLLLLFMSSVVTSILVAVIANSKGRPVGGWAVYGFFLGIIALIHVIAISSNAPIAGVPQGGFAFTPVMPKGTGHHQPAAYAAVAMRAVDGRITELAVARSDKAGQVAGEWTSPVSPVRASDAEPPTFEQVFPDLLRMVNAAPIILRTVGDATLLNGELARMGRHLPIWPAVDVTDLARTNLPTAPNNYELTTIARAAGLPDPAPTVAGDARAMLQIVLSLTKATPPKWTLETPYVK